MKCNHEWMWSSIDATLNDDVIKDCMCHKICRKCGENFLTNNMSFSEPEATFQIKWEEE